VARAAFWNWLLKVGCYFAVCWSSKLQVDWYLQYVGIIICTLHILAWCLLRAPLKSINCTVLTTLGNQNPKIAQTLQPFESNMCKFESARSILELGRCFLLPVLLPSFLPLSLFPFLLSKLFPCFLFVFDTNTFSFDASAWESRRERAVACRKYVNS